MPEITMLPANEKARTSPPSLRNPRPEDYAWRVRHTRPESLIGYWPMDEVSGTVCHDLSGRGNNGTYAGAGLALGKTGIGDGRTCPYFDGATSYVNIYSAGLAAAFNGQEGTLLLWANVASGAWTDGAEREFFQIQGDANNYIYFRKQTTNNQVALVHTAGGSAKTITVSNQWSTGWVSWALTWSVSTWPRLCLYRDGARAADPVSTLGTWSSAGILRNDRCVIGAFNTSASAGWLGNEAHIVLWNASLPVQEIEKIGRRE